MNYFFTFLFFCNTLLFAQTIQEDAQFQAIVSDKKNDSKIVLMLYTAKSCPQCAYMKQKVFTDKDVNAFMQKHFVVLEKDINHDTLPEGFEYFGIPTIFFIDKDAKELERFVGSSRAIPFLETLKKIVKENK